MPRSEHTCAEQVWSIVGQVPTIFGRLVYLASLRDKRNGAYCHPAFCPIFGCDIADRALRRTHQQAFSSWLDLSLECQYSELQEFLRAVAADDGSKNPWLAPEAAANLVPPDTSGHESLLFHSDLDVLGALF